MHSYHDANGKFPYFTQITPVRQNWAPFVMPFLEQGNLVKGYNINLHWYDAANLPTTQQSAEHLLLPQRPARGDVDRPDRLRLGTR